MPPCIKLSPGLPKHLPILYFQSSLTQFGLTSSHFRCEIGLWSYFIPSHRLSISCFLSGWFSSANHLLQPFLLTMMPRIPISNYIFVPSSSWTRQGFFTTYVWSDVDLIFFQGRPWLMLFLLLFFVVVVWLLRINEPPFRWNFQSPFTLFLLLATTD